MVQAEPTVTTPPSAAELLFRIEPFLCQARAYAECMWVLCEGDRVKDHNTLATIAAMTEKSMDAAVRAMYEAIAETVRPA